MKIKVTEYVDPETWDFKRIIREAGYANIVDAAEVEEKVWNGGTRELAITFELDTETGIITVAG